MTTYRRAYIALPNPDQLSCSTRLGIFPARSSREQKACSYCGGDGHLPADCPLRGWSEGRP